MKTLKKLSITVLLIIVGIIALSELNYKLAIKASCKTNCSDSEIENTMYQYGFNVDANSVIHPTVTEKIKALFNHKSN